MFSYLLFLYPLDDVFDFGFGSDGAPGSQPVVPLLVLPLLPELGEDLLVELPTLGVLFFPPLGVLLAVDLLVPLAQHHRVRLSHVPLSRLLVLDPTLETVHQVGLERSVPEAQEKKTRVFIIT